MLGGRGVLVEDQCVINGEIKFVNQGGTGMFTHITESREDELLLLLLMMPSHLMVAQVM